jgi:hypothetical protein
MPRLAYAYAQPLFISECGRDDLGADLCIRRESARNGRRIS